MTEKLRHENPPVATKLQAQIVILVDIATGRMTITDIIPDDRTLQSMRHGSPALPPACRWVVARAVRRAGSAARRGPQVAAVAGA